MSTRKYGVDATSADCLVALELAPQTADEVASLVKKHILAIRPVICRLHKTGMIHPTGEYRKNKVSGKKAKVWALSSGVVSLQ